MNKEGQMKEKSQIPAQVVINKKTGELAEMTKSWFGNIIWFVEYDSIPEGSLATSPWIIYDDMQAFKDYEIVGEL